MNNKIFFKVFYIYFHYEKSWLKDFLEFKMEICFKSLSSMQTSILMSKNDSLNRLIITSIYCTCIVAQDFAFIHVPRPKCINRKLICHVKPSVY